MSCLQQWAAFSSHFGHNNIQRNDFTIILSASLALRMPYLYMYVCTKCVSTKGYHEILQNVMNVLKQLHCNNIPNNISYILGGDAHDLIQIFQQRMFLFLGGTLSYLTENLLLPVFTKLKSNWIEKKVAVAVLVWI